MFYTIQNIKCVDKFKIVKNIVKLYFCERMVRYALVTGSSRGIGKAIALKLSSLGYHVLLNYLKNSEAAQEIAQIISNNGGQAELLPFDTSDSQAIEAALDKWEEKHPDDYISVLVNNAGIRRDNVMFMMPDEDWHQVLDTTLNGFFYVTRRLLKHMMPRGRGGRIINMSSLSGIKGLLGQANYSAAKAAIIGATKALSQEVATRNITVNAIAPGFIDTDMTKELPQEELKNMIPMRRFGKPEEVAALVAFLVSDEAAYITGEVININGGLYT